MKRCFLKLKYHGFMRFSAVLKRINDRNVYLIYIFISKIPPVKLEIIKRRLSSDFGEDMQISSTPILKRIYIRLLTSCNARKSILTLHPTFIF